MGYKVAHIQEQGQQVILVLVASSVGSMGGVAKQELYAGLQVCATAAGLAGAVALVWSNGSGGTDSFGPDAWRPFLRSLLWNNVLASVNKDLNCG